MRKVNHTLFAFATIFLALAACKKNKGINETVPGKDTTQIPVKDTIKPVDTPYVFACIPATFASVATLYNDYFTRGNTVTDQWTGADATYSYPLGDGKILWAFGDTFIGKVYPPDDKHKYRWRNNSSLVSNTFMIQDTRKTPNTFITVVGEKTAPGNRYWPIAKTGNEYKSGTAHEWYWPCDGTVQGDNLYIFFAKFRNLAGGSYSSLGTDVLVFSVSALKNLRDTISTVESKKYTYYTMEQTQYGETHFGSAIMEDGDKDNYVYISDKIDFWPFGQWHCSKVLKVDQKNITGKRQHFTGYGNAPDYTPKWSETYPGSGSKVGNMQQLNKGKLTDLLVLNQFSVIKTKNKYRLIMQSEGENNARNIYSYESKSPVGPWECKTLLNTINEPDSEPVDTYNGFLHSEIKNGNNQYLFSYNLNARNFSDVFSRVDTYRPKFYWITIPD